jgi:hypothetical protein
LLPILEQVKEKRKRGRPPKVADRDREKEKEKEHRPRRTQNTGGVDIEDIDLEQHVTVIKLSVSLFYSFLVFCIDFFYWSCERC